MAIVRSMENGRSNAPSAPLLLAARGVMRLVELAAALLLIAETVVLFASVVYRYVLDDPLTWSDELVSMMFSWLAILGAVLALYRGEHMRLTAVVKKLPPAWQAWTEALATLLVCVFVAMLLPAAAHHAQEQMDITTPSLGIPDGLRAMALPVGAGLMLVAALFRVVALDNWRHCGSALLVVLLIGGALWWAQPALLAMGNWNLLLFFVVLVGAGVVLGVPIAFAFGVATLAYVTLVTHAPLAIVVSRMDEGMANLVLVAVPIFVLLGGMIEMSGMARSLIDFMASLLGHVRGGLQYVLLGAMFLVSGISGSKAADMAAVAPALFPEMKARGAKPEELVALLSATGAMTETIPPSLVLITIGAVCGVSISALFVGGLVPALVATAAIGLVCWRRARQGDAPSAPRAALRTVLRTLVFAIPALALPVLIRACVVEGIATATEVSTVGVVYALVVAVVARMLGAPVPFRRLYRMLVDAAALSGAILLIIGLATSMAWALTRSGFSASLVTAMSHAPGGVPGFMLVTIVCFTVLGSVLEGIPAIVLFGPLLFPVARALHIDDVHYSMVVILAMGLGLFAPPLGVGYYAACAIGKVSPDGVGRRMVGYMAALVVALLLVAFIPWLSTGFLPKGF